ncbi:uncharacterized protein LOC126371112 [Pectinophora gossypiella]|uniref:uncharacterized protein LOC126371112 n=1 Tax=Pectinophora gossypiella TaxID=13191 RepID=UPI00214EBCA1|nr:uncharacterized protein LOC126371112 [Pectinophora gossypiella]
MSLVKLLRTPRKFFQKAVIAFLLIRRHDLGLAEDLIRYMAVKPTASISTLRHKVWHLLDLPDYCEEVIVLKNNENVEIPLTELCKGNEPHKPFILEVWLPGKRMQSTTTIHNHMLTMGREDDVATLDNITPLSECSSDDKREKRKTHDTNSTLSEDTLGQGRLHTMENKLPPNFILKDFHNSTLSSRISNTSLIFRLNGKKSKDNFANILLKIQSDLTTLSKKLSNLENRIPA